MAAASLSARFGHEENLSRYLVDSGAVQRFLARAGLGPVGGSELEVPVRRGAPGKAGRLDILQRTAAGSVVFEVQYGTSDSNHFQRFAGYAASVVNPAAIVWAAERFTQKHIDAAAQFRVPVVLAKLVARGAEVQLRCLGGARLSVQSVEKRVASANKKAWELIERPQVWDEIVRVVEDIESEVSRGHGAPGYCLRTSLVVDKALRYCFRGSQVSTIQTCEDAAKIYTQLCQRLAPLLREARVRARAGLREHVEAQRSWLQKRRSAERSEKEARQRKQAWLQSLDERCRERHELELADTGVTTVALRLGGSFEVDRSQFQELCERGLVVA